MNWLEAVKSLSNLDVFYFKGLCPCTKLTTKNLKVFCVKVKLALHIVAVVSQTVFQNDDSSLRRFITYISILKHIFAY